MLTSGLKVRLPMVFVTLSVNFLVIMVGIVQFSLPEAVLLGVTGTIIQCLWRPRVRPNRFKWRSVVFQLPRCDGGPRRIPRSSRKSARWSRTRCGWVSRRLLFHGEYRADRGVIALTESKPVYQTWHKTYFWMITYHMAAARGMVHHRAERRISGHAAVVLFPLVYFVYRSYRVYIDRLEKDKTHVEEIAGLHLRTIEALALAIEAKDSTTARPPAARSRLCHRNRQGTGTEPARTRALQAAALLHDIGKLAVPEHIISKPGKLTPEEFEKMKIHPLVGAEILEEVKFPYPVVPIVRSHHEKWDGTGYPYGLAGEEIPVGARILSVVDCLDALASDRQYRRASRSIRRWRS